MQINRAKLILAPLLFIVLWPGLLIIFNQIGDISPLQVVYWLLITPIAMLPAVPFMFFGYLPTSLFVFALALAGPPIVAWITTRAGKITLGTGIGLILILAPYLLSTTRFFWSCNNPEVECGEFSLAILGLHAVLAFIATFMLGISFTFFEKQNLTNNSTLKGGQ